MSTDAETARTSDPPPVELFTEHWRSGRNGWAREFVLSLERDIPLPLPDGKSDNIARTVLRQSARGVGRKIATRSFNGRMWVCWVGDLPPKNGQTG